MRKKLLAVCVLMAATISWGQSAKRDGASIPMMVESFR